MIEVSEKLIRETKAMIRLYLFLRHDCGLKKADRPGARELRELLKSFGGQEKVKFFHFKGYNMAK